MVSPTHWASWASWATVVLAASQAAQAELRAVANDVQKPLYNAVAGAANSTENSCDLACLELQSSSGIDGLAVSYADIPSNWADRYYATQQRKLRPACVAMPESAQAVSQVVKAVRAHQCPFAIVSGGQATAPGVNTRADGLVIDLRKMTDIRVSQDNATVSLGPGNSWGRVYSTLEPLGLMVIGGRFGDIGVGGFTIGGGLSFLSKRHGWAADTVRNFEVVLPDGTIASANPESHPDIYFALRGGGSSFGIVTRFDFEAVPYQGGWGGLALSTLRDLSAMKQRLGVRDTLDRRWRSVVAMLVRWLSAVLSWFSYGITPQELADAFSGLSQDGSDPAAHGFLYFSWSPLLLSYVTGSFHYYDQPSEHHPDALKALTSLSRVYANAQNRTVSGMSSLVGDSNPTEQNQIWRTSTFKYDSEFLAKLYDIFLEEVAVWAQRDPAACFSTNFQMLNRDQIAHSSKNGGNVFGLKPEDGPLLIASMTIAYDNADDEAAMLGVSTNFTSRAVQLGKDLGIHHPFIYPNYAGPGQDVFGGFAPENQRRLRDIQQRYDPDLLFARLQPSHLMVPAVDGE